MKTISQIGKAALSRIFKSESSMKGNFTTFERTVTFPNEELSLTKCIFQYTGEYGKNEETTFDTKVQVWGIELGLQDVDIIADGEMLLDSLCSIQKWEKNVYPSHLIITYFKKYSNYSDKCGSEHEDVFIYRISEKQKQDIFKKRNENLMAYPPEFEEQFNEEWQRQQLDRDFAELNGEK